MPHPTRRPLSRPQRYTPPSLEQYKQAVWDYLLEHSEVVDSGTLFIKFHTSGRSQLEGHINNRVTGYHRGDPRAKERELERSRQPVAVVSMEERMRLLFGPPEPPPEPRWRRWIKLVVSCAKHGISR